jgi:hypothetical protein
MLQRGVHRVRARLCPDKGYRQQLQKVVDLLCIMRILFHRLLLSTLVMQKLLDRIALLRLRNPLPVALAYAMHIAVLRRRHPLHDSALRLLHHFVIEPVRVIGLVRCPFGVHRPLNQRLRALRIRSCCP